MNYIKGCIIAHDDKSIIVSTNSGVGYRLEIIGFDVNKDDFDFCDVELFVEETFNTQNGIKTRYAILDYESLKFLWFLKKNVKKIPMKVLVSLVNQFNVDEIRDIVNKKNVKFLTSSIDGLGKSNAEKICNVEINGMKTNIISKEKDDINYIKSSLSALGRKVTSDENDIIAKKLSEGQKRDAVLTYFIKNNGFHEH